MKKCLIILLVILTAGCIRGHYQGHGISFDYPMGWKCSEVMDLPGALVAVSTPSGNAEVIIYQRDANRSLENLYWEYSQRLPLKLSGYCYKQISNRTLTVDDSKAYELIYRIGCDQTQTRQQIRMVILQKGGHFYIIECKVIPPEDFNRENPNFDVIINSLDIG